MPKFDREKSVGVIRHLSYELHRLEQAIGIDGLPEDYQAEFAQRAKQLMNSALAKLEESCPDVLFETIAPSEPWGFEKDRRTKQFKQGLCKGLKESGKPCLLRAQKGSHFCHHHRETGMPTLREIVAGLEAETGGGP